MHQLTVCVQTCAGRRGPLQKQGGSGKRQVSALWALLVVSQAHLSKPRDIGVANVGFREPPPEAKGFSCGQFSGLLGPSGLSYTGYPPEILFA